GLAGARRRGAEACRHFTQLTFSSPFGGEGQPGIHLYEVVGGAENAKMAGVDCIRPSRKQSLTSRGIFWSQAFKYRALRARIRSISSRRCRLDASAANFSLSPVICVSLYAGGTWQTSTRKPTRKG